MFIFEDVHVSSQMALRPTMSSEMKYMTRTAGRSSGWPAVTNYTVLDSMGSAALVECHPITGRFELTGWEGSTVNPGLEIQLYLYFTNLYFKTTLDFRAT